VQVLKTKIEYIDKDTGEVWLRSYGIKDNTVARNSRFKWMTHSSSDDAKSFKGQPVILTPIFDHVINTDSFDAWDAESRNPNIAIGSIDEVVDNKKTKAIDFIWHTVKETIAGQRAAVAIKEGFVPKFVSPAIWSENFEVDDNDIVHYKNYRGVHLAIVKIPAFGEDLAVINEHACVGGARCKQELAAIASFSEEVINKQFDFTNIDAYELLKKNFTVNMIADSTNNKKMEGDQPKTVPYEEYMRKGQEIDTLKTKVEELKSQITNVATERDTFKNQLTEKASELDKRVEQDLRKTYTDYFNVVFDKNETEVKEKVDMAITKKFKQEDLNDLYGHIYEAKQKALEEANNGDDTDNASTSQPSGTKPVAPAGPQAGIASGEVRALRDSATIAIGLANIRRKI